MPERAAPEQQSTDGNLAGIPGSPPAVPHDAHRLRVMTFGPPAILEAGEPIRLPRRQTRALLYRLSAQDTPVSREVLCFLFWPDVPETMARRRLTRLLTHLQKHLPDIVILDRESVGLDQKRVESDAVTFERLVGTTEASSLQHAVALYRGPFLSGFSLANAREFESWALQEQQRFERGYLKALSTLVETYDVQGRYKEAVALAERYLETDDLAEEMHRRLIELYARAGDRAAALRHYERCASLLERELGVAPLPETQAVYEAVLQDQYPARRRPEAAAAPAPAPPSLPDSPLIGRDEAWRTLEQRFAAARNGRGGAVLLAGEAGIGKSRLMHDFAEWQDGHAVLLAGAGYRGAQTVPYLPLVEALRRHLQAGNLSYVAPVWLAEALVLLPELRIAFPELSPPVPGAPDQVRTRLFEALRQIVMGLAGSDGLPLLLCLDDLQWADRATLDWLSYLGHHLDDGRILLIGTYRSDEAEAVGDVRRELLRAGALVELALRPLAEPEVKALLHHLAPEREGDQAMVRRLHTLTGGNPFYLIEIIRMLKDVGQVDGESLPGTVLETVRARLARRSGAAQQVLAAGAVLGDGFTFNLVQGTAGRSELETVEALEELVDHAVLLEDREGAGYRFRHDLFRLVISQDLSLRRWQLLHRRAAQVLEASLTGQPREGWPVGRLGRFYAEAGEAANAASYLIQAGDRARTLYAHDEAITYYRQALPLVEGLGDQQQVARTLMRLGLTYHEAFDFPKAGRMYEQGLVAWQRAGKGLAAAPAPHPLRLPWFPTVYLDPALATGTWSYPVVQHLFSSLAEHSPELDVVPDLAVTWQIRDSGHTYVVQLRDDARWSDGRPLTAGDVEYAWKRLLSPAVGSVLAPHLHILKGGRAFHAGEAPDPSQVGVHATDHRTLIVELEEPVSYFPQFLAETTTCPVPRHALEKYGEAWTDPEHLVSCGPFRLASAGGHGLLELVREPGYHGRFTGNVERIELHGSMERGRLLKEYEAGRLDVLPLDRVPSRDEANWARRRHAGEYVSAPLLSTSFLRFNPVRPPFHDVRVRQALALALDKDALANRVEYGFQSPATGGFVPPGMPGHTPQIGLPYDPDQARHLLAVAGYPGGRGWPTIEAWYMYASHAATLEWLQEQWREVLGIEVPWRLVDWHHGFDTSPDGPPLVFIAWYSDYPDPDSFLRRCLGYFGLLMESGGLVELVGNARYASNQAERLALYGQAEKALMTGATLVPVLYGRQHLLVKPWVKRYPVSPMRWCFWKEVIIEPH